MSRWRTAVVSVLLALVLASVGAGLFARVVNAVSVEVTSNDLAWLLGYVAFAAVGAVVAIKRPEHPIGWMFLVGGFFGALYEAASGVAGLRLSETGGIGAVAGWVATWAWVPFQGLIVWSLVLFPTGRPLARWLGWVGRGAFAVTILVALENAIRTWPVRSPSLAFVEDGDAIGVDLIGLAVGFPLVAAAAVVAMVALVVRFRRADGEERIQLKWLATAAAVAAPALVLGEMVVTDSASKAVLDVLSAPIWFAIAAGIAILRYRLYDIDRIIGRTVTYAVVMAVLVTFYLGSVLALGAVARAVSGGQNDLVVAGSTLVVAALFQPVRRRVQTIVDRRFNRARYDAQQEVERFGGRLRDRVALDDVVGETLAVAGRTVQPAGLSLWMRAGGST